MTKRRTYTKEFKIEAVELADKIDNSAQQHSVQVAGGFA